MNTVTPKATKRSDYGSGISPTSLAPHEQTKNLIIADKILDEAFYTSLPLEERQKLKKGIFFVYGFMEAPGRSWCGDDGEKVAQSAQDRIELIRTMTTDKDCLQRLLQITSAEGDQDLIKSDTGASEYFENYVRSLVRFFSMPGTFGFTDDMNGVVHHLCIQAWENCYLVTGCDFVDLQIQKDVQLKETEKYQFLDKSQVARRLMTATDLINYVVYNGSNCGLDLVGKILGICIDSHLQRLMHTDPIFQRAEDIDYILSTCIRHRKLGPGYLSISAEHLKAPTNTPDFENIPCFDSFEKGPEKYITLSHLTKCEGLVDWQLQGQASRRRRPLDFNGQPGFSHGDDKSNHPVPSLLGSGLSNSKSFIETPHGNEVDRTPAGWSLRSILGGIFGSKKEKALEHQWVSDETAATETENPPEGSDDRKDVRHSVVLIGGIDDTEEQKTWYLMRNSWKAMPLFLASAECLASCETNAAFLKTKISEIPKGYNRTEKRYTECASPALYKDGGWESRILGKDYGFFSGP